MLQASDFRGMEPQVDAGAQERLAQVLHGALPSVARIFMSPRQLAAGAAVVLELVLTTAYPMLRDTLFASLGPLASMEIALPQLPIEEIRFTTRDSESGGNLVLELDTGLDLRFEDVAGVVSSEVI